jgi:serine/threonine-protein kinase RsbW
MREGFTEIEHLIIQSDPAELVLVESLIDKVCADLAVDEDRFGNVLIAVTEAVNNAICHGNGSKAELKVDVYVADHENVFCFGIQDCGQGFDHAHLPDPTSNENIEKEYGRGVFLMRNLADEVEFSQTGSRVDMYFSKSE